MMFVRIIVCLTISICIVHASSPVKVPERLAVYYGWPSYVQNSKGNVIEAIKWFKQFDLIVLGDGIWKSSHGDHAKTKVIIKVLIAHQKKVFGYIALGVNGTKSPNLTEPQMRTAVDGWSAMGVNVRFYRVSLSLTLHPCRVYCGMKQVMILVLVEVVSRT